MHQVLGLMQANAWKPFKRGIGDVIGVTDANHRRVGMETGEYRVRNLHDVPFAIRDEARKTEK